MQLPWYLIFGLFSLGLGMSTLSLLFINHGLPTFNHYLWCLPTIIMELSCFDLAIICAAVYFSTLLFAIIILISLRIRIDSIVLIIGGLNELITNVFHGKQLTLHTVSSR